MIIVQFCGGLGNQLYKYAVYRYLQNRYPKQVVKADKTFYEDHLNIDHGYGLGLEKFFHVKVDIATKKEIKKANYEVVLSDKFKKMFPKLYFKLIGKSKLTKLRLKLSKKYKKMRENYITCVPYNLFNEKILNLNENENYYLNGYWQNIKYLDLVENDLKKELIFRTDFVDNPENVSSDLKNLHDDIKNSNSVCLHVRRGDFVDSKHAHMHLLCDENYYLKCTQEIKKYIKNCKFFVFSDDIQYCKNLFGNKSEFVYVSEEYKLGLADEMFLMSECKSAIICNSTFSFWTSWLSDHPDKVVLYPKYLTREGDKLHEFSVPSHWKQIVNVK